MASHSQQDTMLGRSGICLNEWQGVGQAEMVQGSLKTKAGKQEVPARLGEQLGVRCD